MDQGVDGKFSISWFFEFEYRCFISVLRTDFPFFSFGDALKRNLLPAWETFGKKELLTAPVPNSLRAIYVGTENLFFLGRWNTFGGYDLIQIRLTRQNFCGVLHWFHSLSHVDIPPLSVLTIFIVSFMNSAGISIAGLLLLSLSEKFIDTVEKSGKKFQEFWVRVLKNLHSTHMKMYNPIQEMQQVLWARRNANWLGLKVILYWFVPFFHVTLIQY